MRKPLVALLALGAVLGFGVLPFMAAKAPIPMTMLYSHKIFYYHVPAAWIMFISVFVSGIAAAGFLFKRKASWDDVAAAAGDLTVLFGAIVMTSGPLWGKAHWGAYWQWDARLTTSLLLWMIFIAYALVRRYGGPGSERLAAGLAFFGMADVPLVYFAVNFWRTQHPSNSTVPESDPAIKGVLYISFLAYLAVYLLMLFAYVSVRRAKRRVEELEEHALDTGRLE